MFVLGNYVDIYQGECSYSYFQFSLHYAKLHFGLHCRHSSCVAGWAGVDISPLPNLEYDCAVQWALGSAV